MQYSNWLEEWLDKKEATVKESTYQTYRYAIKKHLIPDLGEYSPESIDTKKVQNTTKSWEAKGLSAKTIADYVILIKTTLKEYSKQKNVELKPIEIKISRKRGKQIKIFSKDDQRKIIFGIYKELKPKTIGIALGLCAGLRIGEICGLKWKDIDLKDNLLYVNSTVQRLWNEKIHHTQVKHGTTKSIESTRSIPIDSTLKVLLSMIEAKDKEVFLLTGTRKSTEPKNLRRYFYSFLKKNEVEKKPFHCLRHSFGTRAISCGVDPKTLQEIMGHSNVETTLNLYVHPQIEDKRKAMEKMNMQWLQS